MATRNISSGGKHSQFLGLPELKKKIKGMNDAMASAEVQDLVAMIAGTMKKAIVSSALSKKVPSDVIKNIFSTGGAPMGSRNKYKVAALTGLRKRGPLGGPYSWGYREWRVAGAYTRVKFVRVRGAGGKFGTMLRRGGEMKAGGKVGENLGTMWELGTSHPWMPARPWFRPVLMSMRNTCMTLLAGGYRQIIEKYAARP